MIDSASWPDTQKLSVHVSDTDCSSDTWHIWCVIKLAIISSLWVSRLKRAMVGTIYDPWLNLQVSRHVGSIIDCETSTWESKLVRK